MFFNFLRGSEVLRGLNMMPVIYLNSSEGVSACKMFLFTPAPAAGPPLTVTSALLKLNLTRACHSTYSHIHIIQLHSPAFGSSWRCNCISAPGRLLCMLVAPLPSSTPVHPRAVGGCCRHLHSCSLRSCRS